MSVALVWSVVVFALIWSETIFVPVQTGVMSLTLCTGMSMLVLAKPWVKSVLVFPDAYVMMWPEVVLLVWH